MTVPPHTNEPACDQNCSTCASAQPHSAPSGLPPKAKIDVRHVILVLSGKGGVGKSTVAVNLASVLAGHGRKVGLLDLDFHGPNIPKMLGIENQRPAVLKNSIEPVRVTGNLAVMSMAFLLPDTSSPVVWRGPMKMTAIRQFLAEVNWGALDYLVVDLPPGTGDEALTIAQLAPNVRGAVIVTTPQDVAVMDATKAVKFIEKLDLPVLGIIENMSGMVCPHCKGTVDVFGEGGGKKAAEDLGVPFLGAIPLDPELVRAGDAGRPFILRHTGSPTYKATDSAMQLLVAHIESKNS
ncbi:Mrp/NBP35 family ATP-binding protein [Methanoregula sp.]|uniref:Mrp/NBP35 family ATP-binding protein n=1 Tax=Methanoregula sp. TaxID=2052170 RepID=UPI002B90B0CF|nr:Mrp/NBP35 family ATP-binding protein [Methanoregula sp.]HVP96646.1 Mrp/NBP35 family ATP-binding protein [Methanoregula sp.]